MKKILIATIIASSLISQSSFAEGFYHSNASEVSVISVVLSPVLSSIAVDSLFKELSRTSTPVKVTKVEHKENNKTLIKGVAKDTPIEFEANTKAVVKSKVKENDNINIKDAKLGHVLECNNVALGVVPNAENVKNFKQEKLN